MNFPISLTIPFLNYVWRTELFRPIILTDNDGQEVLSTSDRLRVLFEQGDAAAVHHFTDILRGLAERVDHYQKFLWNPEVRKLVGLVPETEIEGDGYQLRGRSGGRFVDTFVISALLDRYLSTQSTLGHLKLRQSLHPRSALAIPLGVMDYGGALGHLKTLSVSVNTIKSRTGEFRIHFPTKDTESTQAVTLTVMATYYDALGYLTRVTSNIIVVAVTILVLSKGKKGNFIQKVKTDMKNLLGNTFLAKRVETIFSRLCYRKVRHIYTAITGSILDVLDPEWGQGSRNPREGCHSQDLVEHFLRRTGRRVDNVPGVILVAETMLWRMIFDIIRPARSRALKLEKLEANNGSPGLSLQLRPPMMGTADNPWEDWHAQVEETLGSGILKLSDILQADEMVEPYLVNHGPPPLNLNWPDLDASMCNTSPGLTDPESSRQLEEDKEVEEYEIEDDENDSAGVLGAQLKRGLTLDINDQEARKRCRLESIPSDDPGSEIPELGTTGDSNKQVASNNLEGDGAGSQDQSVEYAPPLNLEGAGDEESRDNDGNGNGDDGEGKGGGGDRGRGRNNDKGKEEGKNKINEKEEGRLRWRVTGKVAISLQEFGPDNKTLITKLGNLGRRWCKTAASNKAKIKSLPNLFAADKPVDVERRDITICTFIKGKNNSIIPDMVNFNCKWYTHTPNRFDSLRSLASHVRLLEPSLPNSNSSAGYRVFLESQLRDKTSDELNDLFTNYDLHILPEDGFVTSKDAGFSLETCRSLGINADALRDFEENRFLSVDSLSDVHMRKDTLRTLLSRPLDDNLRLDINCLDIQLPNGFAQTPLLVRNLSILDALVKIPSHAHVGWKFLAWALVTTAPAKSTSHFDAGGFATWIHVVSGTKVFFIRDDETSQTPGEPCTQDPLRHKWIPIVLRPGHKLIMRPGREHMVYTLQDCIARGGHFYSHHTFRRTFHAVIRESIHGRMSTNDVCKDAQTVLLRVLKLYHERWRDVIQAGINEAPFPVDSNLAALFIMFLYPEHLDSQWTAGRKLTDALKKDRADGSEIAFSLLSCCMQLLPEMQNFTRLLSGFKSLAETQVERMDVKEEEINSEDDVQKRLAGEEEEINSEEDVQKRLVGEEDEDEQGKEDGESEESFFGDAVRDDNDNDNDNAEY